MQYAQKSVRLISRSNSSTQDSGVICPSVKAGGAVTRSTIDTTKTGLFGKSDDGRTTRAGNLLVHHWVYPELCQQRHCGKNQGRSQYHP